MTTPLTSISTLVSASAGSTGSTGSTFSVLVFSGTAAFRHDSIPAGVAAFERLAAASSKSPGASFTVTHSEDAGAYFTPTALAGFRVLVLLQTSGNFLTGPHLAVLKGFVRAGGGVVSVHCASTGMPSSGQTEEGAQVERPRSGRQGPDEVVDREGWYGRLVGGVFTEHPVPQSGRVLIEDPSHPIMLETVKELQSNANASNDWRCFDEWYNFRANPRTENGVHVLLRVDESSYEGGTLGEDHPIAWCHEFEGGRSFYTSMGHFDKAYEDDDVFTGQLFRAILWTAREI